MSVQTIPFGDAGSTATLRHMRALINDALRNPTTVDTAQYIIRHTPPRAYAAMAQAIRDWLSVSFKFMPDPYGVELTRTPENMLNAYNVQGWIGGDCDDAAILGCALAKSVGIPCKLVAIGFQSPTGSLSHVFGVLLPPASAPLDVDVTKPAGHVAQVRRRVELAV